MSVSTQAKKPLPGISTYSQYGFDPTKAAFTNSPVFAPSYTSERTVSYNNGTYLIPDQLQSFQPETSTSNYSLKTIMQDEEQYNEAYSISTTDSVDGIGFSASASSTLAYTGSLFQSTSKQYFLNFAVQNAYEAAFSQAPEGRPVTAAFSAAASSLPTTITSADDYAQYAAFFAAYGTHYFVSGSFGGYFVMESSIESSLVTQQSSTSVAASISAGFSDGVSSGTLSADAIYENSSYLNQYREEILISTETFGGKYDVSVAEFFSSCFRFPILLLGISDQSPAPQMTPVSSLVPTAIQATMNDAIEAYLKVPLLSVPKPFTMSTNIQATSDSILVGFNSAVESGGGRMYGYTDSNLNPTTLRAVASTRYIESVDAWATSAAMTTPVRQGDYAQISTLVAWQPSPEFSAVLSKFSPTNLGPILGEWADLGTGSLTGTAETDGFLATTTTVTQQNDVGSSKLIIDGNLRGAYDTQMVASRGDWIPSQSFCVPVCQGESYSLVSSSTLDDTVSQTYWLPLNALALEPCQAIDANTAFQAATDGFLVVVLQVPESGGPRGYVELKQAPTQIDLDVLPPITGTAVHYYDSDDADIYLMTNTAMMPVSKGTWYQASVIEELSPVNSYVWWIPLINPEIPNYPSPSG